ncbi:ABC transporter ATP-binding protein [Acuticoccus sediminis]|nr:ABC transporter ATP-binding protein [Acuticoccus sediminis]
MLLEATGVRAGYGKLTILQGMEIAAEAGKITTVLGPNGAGKSTLMKAVAGHLPITGGTVCFEGEDITRLGALASARAGIGYVPQERNVFAGLSVADNLRVAALAYEGAEARVAGVLERFPILAERRRQAASTLSGGERQTLAIATALVGAPRLLLLDEPTAGLAPIFVQAIIDWVRTLTGDGMAVIWVIEQDPEAVLAISDTTTVIAAGQTRETLPSAELLEPGRLESIIFETDDT